LKRNIDQFLLDWKTKENRLPLVLRGARQVGKSYAVDALGRTHFTHYVSVNFEKSPEAKACFSSLKSQDILNKLNVLLDTHIVPGKSLLFLDEIQDCPQALMALRYFREDCPDLHVIAAGSLLEFVLEQDQFRMPVGRVQYIYVRPLSFQEFSAALGHHLFLDHLAVTTVRNGLDPVFHQKGLDLLKQYMAIGGMPGVIHEYIHSKKNISDTYRMQAAILQTYRDDFAKYSTRTQGQYLQKVFEQIPKLVGRQIKYVEIDRSARSSNLKQAITLLAKSGIVTPIFVTAASGLPLSATEKTAIFKTLFLDTGLAVNACKLGAQIQFADDVMTLNQGAIAEQLVGQELIAYQDPFSNDSLYHWVRLEPGSQAEVDYVVSLNGQVVPLEVKSGKTGRLRSMLQFVRDKKALFGVKISQSPLSFDGTVLSVPLYMIAHIERLAAEVVPANAE
jgi:predicted AAA+ superfamily ATPase